MVPLSGRVFSPPAEDLGEDSSELVGGCSVSSALQEQARKPTGRGGVEIIHAGELRKVYAIVGKKLINVAGETRMPSGEVRDAGIQGAAFGGDIGARVEAVSTRVLVAAGCADRGSAAAVGRTPGWLRAADRPGPAWRSVGTEGGTASRSVFVSSVLSFVHDTSWQWSISSLG